MFEEPKMEKLTINLTPVDLGKIDVLIESGIYPNRAECIRFAVRKELDSHQKLIDEKIESYKIDFEKEKPIKDDVKGHYVAMGVVVLDKKAFEKALKESKKMRIFVIGLCSISKDVTPELVKKTVESIRVYGVLKASSKVKSTLKEIMS